MSEAFYALLGNRRNLSHPSVLTAISSKLQSVMISATVQLMSSVVNWYEGDKK